MVQLCYSNSRIKVWNNKIHLHKTSTNSVLFCPRIGYDHWQSAPFPGHYHNRRRCVTVFNVYSKQEKIISASVFIDKTPAGTRPHRSPVAGRAGGGWEIIVGCENWDSVVNMNLPWQGAVILMILSWYTIMIQLTLAIMMVSMPSLADSLCPNYCKCLWRASKITVDCSGNNNTYRVKTDFRILDAGQVWCTAACPVPWEVIPRLWTWPRPWCPGYRTWCSGPTTWPMSRDSTSPSPPCTRWTSRSVTLSCTFPNIL